MAEADFRLFIRTFTEKNCPEALRNYPYRFPAPVTDVWYKVLHNAGLIAPGWPVAYGGMGLEPARHLIFIEEMERAGAPFLHDSGVRNLGPALLAWGTQEQKDRYLPAMHAGDDIWCQGYSEPSAGSDLASLSCSARIEGQSLFINGQKIWTTSATEATHMFALVRTAKSEVKQQGITFVLIDMALPGITVRPIDNLSGHSDFCEVFFDDVEVGLHEVLGEIHQGWDVARSQLGFERIWAGSPKRAVKTLGYLKKLMATRELDNDPLWQDKYAQASFDTLDAQDLYARFADLVGSGGALGPEVSALKIFSTQTFQALSELLIDVAAEDGGIAEPVVIAQGELDLLAPYYESRAPAIFAGTNEIHRNILARAVLGLPKST